MNRLAFCREVTSPQCVNGWMLTCVVKMLWVVERLKKCYINQVHLPPQKTDFPKNGMQKHCLHKGLFMLGHLIHLVSVARQKWLYFNQESVTFISGRVPEVLCSVNHIIIFCRVMRMVGVNIALKIVLTELSCWYFTVRVKYGYREDDWNLLPKHKLKTLRYSFIPAKRQSLNWPEGGLDA